MSIASKEVLEPQQKAHAYLTLHETEMCDITIPTDRSIIRIEGKENLIYIDGIQHYVRVTAQGSLVKIKVDDEMEQVIHAKFWEAR